MSGQSAKKKRLGSRRAASRKKETSEADEFHKTEAEESVESVSVMSNPDEFRPETDQPVPANRRKLGSSRRHKGRQHVKDSENDTWPEMREEAEKSSSSHNFETTQTSEQVESQEEISQGSEHAISVPLKSSSCSTDTHEYYSDVIKTSPACPEEPSGGFCPNNENKLQSLQTEEMKEDQHEDGISQITGQSVHVSCPSADKRLVSVSPLNFMDMSDQGFSHFHSVEETRDNQRGSADLFTKHGHLQDNSMISEESVVLESETPEITTDTSCAREIIEVKHSLEQPVLSPLKEEGVANEEQNEHFSLFEGSHAQHIVEAVGALNDETQVVSENEHFPESQTLHPPEGACSGQAEITNTPNPQCSKQTQQFDESQEEVSEHTNKNENLQTIMSPTTDETNEELSEGGKHKMSVPSDSSLLSELEAGFQVSDKSFEDTLKRLSQSETLEDEEIGTYNSVDDIKNKLKEGFKPTLTEELMSMFDTFENDAENANDWSEMFTEPLTAQTETCNIDSAAIKKDSNSDWKQDENHHEPGHMYKNGDLDDSSCQEADAGFDHSGKGSMLGSGCRDEERQQIKASEVELSGDADSGETPETITIPLTTETNKEQSLSVSHDSTVFSVSTIGRPSDVHSSLVKMFPDSEMESTIPEWRNDSENQCMRETGFKVEISDKLEKTKMDDLDSSDSLESEEVKDVHLPEDDEEEASEDQVNPTPKLSSYHALHEAADLNDSEMLYGIPTDHTETPESHRSEVKNTHDSATKQQNVFPDADPAPDVNPTKEGHSTSENENEFHLVDDSKQSWIEHTGMGDVALGGVHDDEDQSDVLDDAGDNPEISSGNLTEVEIKSTNQYEMMEEGFSETKQKHSVDDDPQVEHYPEESHLEPSDQKNESSLHHANDPELRDVERLSPDCGDVDKGGMKELKTIPEEVFSEADEDKSAFEEVCSKTPFDSQLQENSACIEEKAERGSHSSDNSRELSSSLKYDRTESFEDSATESCDKPEKEADAQTAGEDPSGKTESVPAVETEGLITSVETIMEGTHKSDSSQAEEENAGGLVCTSELTAADLLVSPSEDKQMIDQPKCKQMLHDEHSSVVSVKDGGTDKSTQPLKQEGNFHNYSVNEPCVGSTTAMISPENSSHEEQTGPEQSVNTEVDMSEEEQVWDTMSCQNSEGAGRKVSEPCAVPNQNHEVDQVFSESLKSQNHTKDFHQRELDIKCADDCRSNVKFSDLDNQQASSEQNSFGAINSDTHGTTKKEADNTERAHSAHGDMIPCVEKTPHQDNFSRPQQNNTDRSQGVNQGVLGSSQDEAKVTFLEEIDKTERAKTEHEDVDAKKNTYFSSIAALSDCPNPTVDRQLIKSDSSEVPDEGLPTLYSVSENKEIDKDTQMFELAEHFPGNHSFTDVDSESRKSSVTGEKSSNVEQEMFSSLKEGMAKNREPQKLFDSSEFRDARQSDDVNKLLKDHVDATQMQVTHHMSYSSDLENKPLQQTSETNTYLDSQLQDTFQSINDAPHTGFKPAGNKRRLGSSRRHKGRQQVKEDASEAHLETEDGTTKGDGAFKITEMSLATEKIIREESDDLKFAENVRKNASSASEDKEKLSAEDKFLAQHVMSNRASDFISNSDNSAFLKSNVDTDETDNTLVEEPQGGRAPTGSDMDYMSLIEASHASVWRDESDMQNTSSHDDNASSSSRTKDVVDQNEVTQTQNTEALTCDSDSLERNIDLQKTHDAKGTENKMAESLMDVLEQDEVRRKCEDPTDEGNATQGTYASPSAAQVPEADVPLDGGFSAAMDASTNSESENSKLGNHEILQVKSKQKKRKLGSTRRSLLKGKQDEEKEETDPDVGNVAHVEVVEQLQTCAEVSQTENAPPGSSSTDKEQQETNNASSAHGEEQEQQGNTPDVQSSDSTVTPDVNYLLGLFPQQSASPNVNIVSPGNDVDFRDGEMDQTVTVQPPEIQNVTSPEIQITPEINSQEKENAENTGAAEETVMLYSETTQVTQGDEKPESVEVTQDDQNTNNEGLESAHFNWKTKTNRRRKMGSTRRNLDFHAKAEELHQKQEEDNEATESETPGREATAMTVPEFQEQEVQLHTEGRDHHSQQNEDKVFEAVEFTHVNESQLEPEAQQRASLRQTLETEHQPFVPGSSPSNSDTMSEPASGGRRRKLGSHRKTRGRQTQKDQNVRVLDAEDERNVTSITEVCENTATKEERQESSSRDQLSEFDETQKKPSSSFSGVEAGDPARPACEKTSSKPHHADVTLNQKSGTQSSLVGNPRSNGYNVVMIGDSGVGKTSFMKRAQSGKFSLTLPSSIGVDSCMWTVVVDGKPVVLHVWDTAGQERFRSITRQVFHRAQAFLLMYDISSAQSFSAVRYWANCIQESGAENVVVLLLGNKSDSADRKVQTEQGEVLAQECNFGFMECSAATGENVIQSLESVARMLSQTSGSRKEAALLLKEPEKKKGSRCC